MIYSEWRNLLLVIELPDKAYKDITKAQGVDKEEYAGRVELLFDAVCEGTPLVEKHKTESESEQVTPESKITTNAPEDNLVKNIKPISDSDTNTSARNPNKMSNKDKEQYRQDLTDVIMSAIDNKIYNFEFTGPYYKKTLAKWAKEAASIATERILRQEMEEFKKTYAIDKHVLYGYSYDERIITIRQEKKGEDIRVYCKIDLLRAQFAMEKRKLFEEERIAYAHELYEWFHTPGIDPNHYSTKRYKDYSAEAFLALHRFPAKPPLLSN